MSADNRNLEQVIFSDLKKKFVFLSGPRQVGKTTLAKKIIQKTKGRYLLYDDEKDRQIILQKGYIHEPWVCLDEFHKFPRWKNHIKGVFDKYHENLHLILTGSARLDVYQKSGDSLFGRYYLHHLHPFTCGETESDTLPGLPEQILKIKTPASAFQSLFKFGGFPEPFYAQSEEEHRRWSNARRNLLVREELREISQVTLLALVEQLLLLLPARIGGLFSYHALAEDIHVSVPTIQNWMNIFEKLFIIFKIPPYTTKIARSLKRQPKYYFYDWSQIPDPGARFENFVASHLWKAVQVWTDLGKADLDLYYLRDRDRREVDFLVAKNKKPWFLVECKLSEMQIHEPLHYFSKVLGIPALQLTFSENSFREEGHILLTSASRWLGWLP